MENKNGHHGGNVFIWGLVTGAFITTLLTTKKGRQILRELTNLGLELFEDFVEEKTRSNNSEKKAEPNIGDIEEAKQDLESEITEVESQPTENGHKKRLFKGIKRK